jgi:nucleotide-binding universal stress UspA family protein
MYDRILVALDGSDTSEQALQHAIRLASEQRAKLRLLHVVDELGVNLGQTPTPDAFWIAARKAGDRILEQANARVATVGLEAETKLLEMRTFGAVVRRVADLIVEEAQRWPADLIVVGTHGRRGLSKILLGSVAEGVIRLSSLPVLLIRGPDTDSR